MDASNILDRRIHRPLFLEIPSPRQKHRWDENYERTDEELGLGGKLIASYNLLLTNIVMAVKAAVRGMAEGWYMDKGGNHR